MLRLEPLGTCVVLPAFVVGYELADDLKHFVDDWDDSPDWLLTIDQQAGGDCMSYPSVVGVVFRFCDNRHHCNGDIDTVVRGFQAMAEDSRMDLLRRDYPLLSKLVHTHGEYYNNEQLQCLHRCLTRYFNISNFASGIEAFVRMAESDPMQYFRNWKMLHATVHREPRQLYFGRKCIYIDTSNIDSIELVAKGTFGTDVLNVLQSFGRRLRTDNLEVFLLWENSD